MPTKKKDIAAEAEKLARAVADSMGYELVEVSADRENTGLYLRFYVDREEGITLDDCEAFHRALQPRVEHLDYDFMEVCSPGVDRPIKTRRDADRALGQEVEVHLFRPIDGSRQVTGILTSWQEGDLVLRVNGEERAFNRKDIALARCTVDLEGIEEVDLGEA